MRVLVSAFNNSNELISYLHRYWKKCSRELLEILNWINIEILNTIKNIDATFDMGNNIFVSYEYDKLYIDIFPYDDSISQLYREEHHIKYASSVLKMYDKDLSCNIQINFYFDNEERFNIIKNRIIDVVRDYLENKHIDFSKFNV